MYYYEAKFDSETVNSHRAEGDYAEWSETCKNTFRHVTLVPQSSYRAIKSNVNLVTSDGWLVWVETSSGDSFGSGSRTGTDAIGIFATKEVAMQCAELVSSHASDRKSGSHQFIFLSPDGNDVDIGFAPWADYFGGLDEVHVQRVNLHQREEQADREDSKITVHD